VVAGLWAAGAGHVAAMKASLTAAAAAAEQHQPDAYADMFLVHATFAVAILPPTAVTLPLLSPMETLVQQELKLPEVSLAAQPAAASLVLQRCRGATKTPVVNSCKLNPR